MAVNRKGGGGGRVLKDGEVEGGVTEGRGGGAGYYPASIYSSQGWLDA